MSSNRNDAQSDRSRSSNSYAGTRDGGITSIRRKIHGLWLREKIRRIFWEDVLIAVIMHIIFLISNAYISYGDSFVSRPYSISSGPKWALDGMYAVTVKAQDNFGVGKTG